MDKPRHRIRQLQLYRWTCSLTLVLPQLSCSSRLALIVVQIASWMHPMDVLHCARASKVLRKVLLSRANRTTWISALGSLPKLPPCPEDMSEPLYTALVFDDHCFVSLQTSSTIYLTADSPTNQACGVSEAFAVNYALRVRLCDGCFEDKCVLLLPRWSCYCSTVSPLQCRGWNDSLKQGSGRNP